MGPKTTASLKIFFFEESSTVQAFLGLERLSNLLILLF